VVDFSQRIKDLESKLKNANQRLKVIAEESLKLESKNHSQIVQKERELEEWRDKLEICQQERNQIKKEIREKVLQLEKSNLTNSEKQSKINKLLTEHSEELEELDQLLYDERSQYRKIRDKVIERLIRPCQTCLEKEKYNQSLEKRVNNLIIAGILLLLSAIFWCFLFLGVIFRKKKKKQLSLSASVPKSK
jgi:Fe2+ transport system protein B